MKLKSKYTNEMMMLVNCTTGVPVHVGDTARTFRGEEVIVLGGEPPRNENSTGRVHVEVEGKYHMEYFPNVIDAKWIQIR
jgi:hypothetical protein